MTYEMHTKAVNRLLQAIRLFRHNASSSLISKYACEIFIHSLKTIICQVHPSVLLEPLEHLVVSSALCLLDGNVLVVTHNRKA